MYKPIIVILNGSNGAGKDSFVNKVDYTLRFEKSVFGSDRVMVSHLSSISAIKKMLLTSQYWDGVKDERGRKLLSDVKDAVDKYDKTIITDQLISDVFTILETNDERELSSLVFIDIREPENIDNTVHKLEEQEEIEVYTVLIKGSEDPVANNSADQNVEDYAYDYTYTLVHDRSDVLKSCAENFISEIYPRDTQSE